MPSTTTLILGSMAPGARSGKDHSPPPPPPLLHCQQGDTATLTSCSPPWVQIGVTYLKPAATRPQPVRARSRQAIPWLSILGIAAIAAGCAMGAAYLWRKAATVEVADSALSAHAVEVAWRASAALEASAAPVPTATATPRLPPRPQPAPLVIPSQLPPLPTIIPIPALP